MSTITTECGLSHLDAFRPELVLNPYNRNTQYRCQYQGIKSHSLLRTNLHVFGLWVKAGGPRVNALKHRKNKTGIRTRNLLAGERHCTPVPSLWKKYEKFIYLHQAGSSIIVFIVIHSCAHGSSAVIENACGPNPFICPQSYNGFMCVCVCVREGKTNMVCVCVSAPSGGHPLFQTNPSWHCIAEVRSPC